MTESTEETLDVRDSDVSGVDETIASVPQTIAGTGAVPNSGSLVGRYVVLSKLGAGAMGVVLAAYDPELDRKVAVKLLKSWADQDAARARLQREAQALAKLDHPNVVAVHDVGVHAGRVFVAMEFVEGQTLGDWMKGGARSWREVVRTFEAAGRGLAAAHAAGLVHRDFKPDNVMVGDDGRVRVMDFGLARAREEEGPRPTELGAATQSALDTRLTQTGAVMGTPAYMAPEQFAGSEVTARSDQFGFCVALFEALYGVRPFGGNTLAQLAFAVTKGERVEPRNTSIPGWLRAVVRRGLSSDPAQRYPDMLALLAVLETGESRRRRARAVAALIAVGVAAASVFGYRRWDETQRIEACVAAGDSIDEVWSEGVRSGLRDGLLATKVSYAEMTIEKVMPYFDAQAEALRVAQTEACLDTRVRKLWNEELLDRASWCLDERRMEFEALVDELSRADQMSVQKAVAAATNLSSVASCRDEHRLAVSPAPPENREAVRAVRAKLAEAGALALAGKYEEGLDLARAALTDAEPLDWPALTASARVRVGQLLEHSGEPERAEAMLEDAYFEAATVGASEVAADAAARLVYTVGYARARAADGRRWFRLAEVALHSLGEPDDGLHRASVLHSLAAVENRNGDYDQAKLSFEQAMRIRQKALGAQHPAVAATLNGLANVHYSTGAHDDAKALYERALAIQEKAFGPEHPRVAIELNNLAGAHYQAGDHDQAKLLFERTLSIREKALGPEHHDVGTTLHNLGRVVEAMEAYDEADVFYRRAIAILEKSLGYDHPELAVALTGLADIHRKTGDHDEAKALYERALSIAEQRPEHPTVASALVGLALVHEATGAYDQARLLHERALAIREKALGPEHLKVAWVLNGLASVQLATGAHDDATASWGRALAIWETALGPEHSDLAIALTGLAEIALLEDRPIEALPLAERAMTIRSSGDTPGEQLAESRFLLARVLWQMPQGAGRDRVRARALAEQARDGFRDTSAAESLAKAERWLAAHADSI